MPQITPYKFAGVLIAALALVACSSASTTEQPTTSPQLFEPQVVDTSVSTASDVAAAFARGVQAAASANGIEITDDESACMTHAILTGLGSSRLVALADQSGDIESLDPSDQSAMVDALATCVPADKLLSAGLASSETEEILNAKLLAGSITDSLKFQGLTITPNQADCMANSILHGFTADELLQVAFDDQVTAPAGSDVEARAMQLVIACLPPEVVAAIAHPHA